MFEELRKLYSTGATFDVAFRKERLRRLAACLEAEHGALESALKADLGKSAEEAWLTEIGFVEREIAHALRHIDRWMRDKSVRTPLFMFPGKSRLVAQPRGLVLIISPWNYPIQLSLSPLVAALSAGNVAVVKPSEFAPATSHWLAEHLPKVIGSDVVAVVEGGVPETTEILAQKFDFIFFTGSTRTAKVIAHAAAEHLTPTVLELGGKSPCIVVRCGDVESAARRIAFAKFVNAGQTCVAPDYVVVEKRLRDGLISALKKSISSMYGPENAPQSMAHIINARHFERLERLLGHGEHIIYGGARQAESLVFAPTLIEVMPDHPIMRDEIFGPILPIIVAEDGILPDAIIDAIEQHPLPLAAYLFSDSKKDVRAFRRLRCGGFVHNDALIQLANIDLQFGGVGDSGHGYSHGYAGFEAFSHLRSDFYQSSGSRFDFSIKYPPYTEKSMKWLRRLLGH